MIRILTLSLCAVSALCIALIGYVFYPQDRPDRHMAQDRADVLERLSEVIAALGYDTYLNQIVDGSRTALDHRLDQLGQGLKPERRAALDQMLEAHLSADAVIPIIAERLAASLPPGPILQIGYFYESELGQKVRAAGRVASSQDLAVMRAGGLEEIERMAKPDHPRVVLYESLALERNDAALRSAEEIFQEFIVYVGLEAAGLISAAPTLSEVLSSHFENKQPSEVAGDAHEAFLRQAYIYRDLSDEDLAAYAAHLQSDASRALTYMIADSLMEIYHEQSRKLIEALNS